MEKEKKVVRKMHIGRETTFDVCPHSVLDKLDHCLDHLEKDGFEQDVDWDTHISRSVSVEEVVGAMLHSKKEIERLTKLIQETMDEDID